MEVSAEYVKDMILEPAAYPPRSSERLLVRQKIRELLGRHRLEEGNGLRIIGISSKEVTSIVQSCKNSLQVRPRTTVRRLDDGSVNLRIERDERDDEEGREKR